MINLKISTKGRYGLRAIIDLILHSHGENVPLITIAERQNISKNYLEQVFSSLRKAGIVSSIKGAQGGYFLAKDPSDISVGDVLRILEGDLSLAVLDSETKENQIEKCIYKNVWTEIDKKVNEVINNITLEDLVKELNEGNDILMYYI